MIDISLSSNKYLKDKNNLLAFSSGIDSTALFFILLNKNIQFDLAIVNHNLRKQSKEEVVYAKNLAKKYNKKIYIKELYFNNKTNLEAAARTKRYQFFDDIVLQNNYDNLITAHQLDDKLEWFLMQLSKGAGLVEILGIDVFGIRHIRDDEFLLKKTYNIIRPLLEITKQELQSYLDTNSIKYFIDSSNVDNRFKRNYFRQKFSSDFLKENKVGIKKSFKYLHKDVVFFPSLEIIHQENKYVVYKNNINHTYRLVDKAFKEYGVLLSKAQKDEIIQTKDCVISSKIAVFVDDSSIHIAPYVNIVIPKKIKEQYRISKIPPKMRGYLYYLRKNK